MSSGRFASLTGDLLVRKGEAGVSSLLPSPAVRSFTRVPESPVAALVLRGAQRSSSAPLAGSTRGEPICVIASKPMRCSSGDGSPHASKSHRVMVTLTGGEYETLGLIGVKKGFTRHQLVRKAVDEYLVLLVEEYGGACQCIYTGCSCRGA